MKIPWLVASTLAVSVVALARGPTVADPGGGGPEPAAQTIRIRAWIDGRSRLLLDDDTAQWQHFDFAAPGRNECNLGVPAEPTSIAGVEWWPQWPDVPDCENRSCGGCTSDVLSGLVPGVPDATQRVTIVPIQVRSECTLVEPPSSANGYRVVVEFDDNGPVGSDWYEIDLVLEPSVGEPYCTSTPNSTGAAATLSADGSLSLVANDTFLGAHSCPPGCLGIFFYGGSGIQLPFGNGYLCVSPLDPGLLRVAPAMPVDAGGEAHCHLDLESLPTSGPITAGSTWCFQFWFRDPKAGGAGTNLTDALRLTFVD
jgi:hypothetical protein